MSKLLKMFGVCAMSAGLCAVINAAEAAPTARGGNAGVRTGGVPTTARMPSMPTLTLNNIGNIPGNLPNANTGGGSNPPGPNVTPDVPTQEPECPDGGVKNSDYTVETCMNELQACINNGALPNGMNDMFNEDVRNAIINGMGLCALQVDRCMENVRRDCEKVYTSASAVWIDFNSRRVQPEYYNFVLRKTGLTPNQAENTCLLLDRNVYGSSFAALNASNTVTNEYQKVVGAYNSQMNNTLTKDNPIGVDVNTNGMVDAQRGHYARWDAATATCLVRVAAYNKDKHITNNWLFGAIGDDTPAEVWQPAGSSFTCNKDLFGFSLMNNTKTVAVVGIGGGAVLGTSIGAMAGHGDRAFDCNNKQNLKKLSESFKDAGTVASINQFLTTEIKIGSDLTVAQCNELVDLYNKYYEYDIAVSRCEGKTAVDVMEAMLDCGSETNFDRCLDYVIGLQREGNLYKNNGIFEKCRNNPTVQNEQQCINHLAALLDAKALDGLTEQDILGPCSFKSLNLKLRNGSEIMCDKANGRDCIDAVEMRGELNDLKSLLGSAEILAGDKSNYGKAIGIGAAAGVGAGGLATAITALVEKSNISCHVGDGLSQVGLNKSYTIESLKDYYVKWNLRLPDTVTPSIIVTDCATWKQACSSITNTSMCEQAQINYKPAGSNMMSIPAACQLSGSICSENLPVATSYGACP